MATFKNTRPTIVQRPNGQNVLPGDTFQADAAEMANPGMKILADAGYLVEVQEDAPAPKAPAAPPAPKGAKAAKLKAVAEADADGLLKMAEGETDKDVMAAIEARAASLTEGK